jgi:hypothetical protein
LFDEQTQSFTPDLVVSGARTVLFRSSGKSQQLCDRMSPSKSTKSTGSSGGATIAAFFPSPASVPLTVGFTGASTLAVVCVCASAKAATNIAIKPAPNCQSRKQGKAVMMEEFVGRREIGGCKSNLRAQALALRDAGMLRKYRRTNDLR